MKIFAFIALSVMASNLQLRADDSPDIRSEHDVTLQYAGGNKTFHVAKGAYFGNGILTLFPGDHIFVEFDLADSGPKNPHVVAKNEHPDRTIEFSISQKKDMTMIIRQSGIAKDVTMDCYYFAPLGSQKKHAADMFPLQKDLAGYDSFSPDAYCMKFLNFGFDKVPKR